MLDTPEGRLVVRVNGIAAIPTLNTYGRSRPTQDLQRLERERPLVLEPAIASRKPAGRPRASCPSFIKRWGSPRSRHSLTVER